MTNLSAVRKERNRNIKVEISRHDTLDIFIFNNILLSVVTPAPVCIEKQESVFSVTGFLTFVVVAATAVSNVIANIDNNNNNNNNNDNNDNVNNNNQISDSDNAMNMGNAGGRQLQPFLTISRHLCLPFFICQAVSDIKRERFTHRGRKVAMVGNIKYLSTNTRYLASYCIISSCPR